MSIIQGSRADKWQTISATIAGGGSLDIDSVPVAAYSNSKYYVEIKSSSPVRFKSFEMFGSKKGSSVEDTVYARLGDTLSTTAGLSVSGASVKLTIGNNESFPVSVKVTKLSH